MYSHKLLTDSDNLHAFPSALLYKGGTQLPDYLPATRKLSQENLPKPPPQPSPPSPPPSMPPKAKAQGPLSAAAAAAAAAAAVEPTTAATTMEPTPISRGTPEAAPRAVRRQADVQPVQESTEWDTEGRWIPGIQFECNDCNRTGTIEMGNFSQYLGIECQRCYSINCEEQTSGARRSGADRTQGTTLTADDYALGAAAAQTALPQVELALAPGCSDMAAQHNSEFACTWCGPDTGRNEKKWCSLKCAADHNLAMAYPNDLSNYDLLKSYRREEYCCWCEGEEATKAQCTRKYCHWCCFAADNYQSVRNLLIAMAWAWRERAANLQ